MRHLATLFFMILLATAATGPKQNAAYVCSLTNQKITSCCCTKKEGILYCNLAKKTIAKCCCKPTASAAKNSR